jgi:hypothetical protein
MTCGDSTVEVGLGLLGLKFRFGIRVQSIFSGVLCFGIDIGESQQQQQQQLGVIWTWCA